MSFNISCYINKNPVNKVNKSLGSVIFSANGNLLEPTNIMNPSIKIMSETESLLGCNYCFIEKFNRYYFIDSIDIIQNNIYQINCSVDVLKTYADEINESNAIISKRGLDEEDVTNRYFNDGTFSTEERSYSKVVEFPNPVFDKDLGFTYLLTCYGGYDYGNI